MASRGLDRSGFGGVPMGSNAMDEAYAKVRELARDRTEDINRSASVFETDHPKEKDKLKDASDFVDHMDQSLAEDSVALSNYGALDGETASVILGLYGAYNKAVTTAQKLLENDGLGDDEDFAEILVDYKHTEHNSLVALVGKIGVRDRGDIGVFITKSASMGLHGDDFSSEFGVKVDRLADAKMTQVVEGIHP